MFKVEFVVNHDRRMRTIKTNICFISDIIEKLKEEYKTEDVVLYFIEKEN